MRGHEPRR